MHSSNQENGHGVADTEMLVLGRNQSSQKAAGYDQELQRMLKKLDQRVHRHLKQAFVLVNLYYFFQGAILTAVSQVSSPKCHQWFFFSVLSIIPFVLNGIPLIYKMCKYVETKNERDTYKLLRERNRAQPAAAAAAAQGNIDNVPRDYYRRTIRYVGVVFAALILAAFNAAMLYGCHSLLCDNSIGTNIQNVVYDGHCFKLCNLENKCLEICTQ